MTRWTGWLSLLCLVCIGAPAKAHFLFVRILPPAEGGRAAEVYFSELAEAGDSTFIDKVAGAQFWLQSKPGDFQPLPMHKLSDRLRAHVPTSGALMVAGQLDYGVLQRATPFLLRHYSKAVAGSADEVNRLQAKGMQMEVLAKFDSQQVTMTARLGGKPLPKATFNWIDASLKGGKLQADADGQVVFAPPGPGVYSIYTSHRDPTAGEHQGTAYKEVREFATLAFNWPLEPKDADAAAVQLFEEAIAARAAWQSFPGFTAKIAGAVLDRPFDGTVRVAADGSVALDVAGNVQEWVQSQLESITMHRAASQTPSAARPRPVLRFGDDHPDHPLGRLLIFDGGEFATSYRVQGRQITSVNRVLSGQNMTITVLENYTNAEGKFLPSAYTVQYWDEPTGRLDRTETVRDEWKRVGSWDLPTQRTATTSSDQGFSVRRFQLTEHQLLAPAGSSAQNR